MERRFLVVTIPKGSCIPYPCCCVEKLRGKKYAWKRKDFARFFSTTRIERRQKRPYILTPSSPWPGRLSLLFTTIIGLFAPTNRSRTASSDQQPSFSESCFCILDTADAVSSLLMMVPNNDKMIGLIKHSFV
jgi:hypothetical protein